MATILSDTSRTFSEYLLIPRLTRKDQRADRVDLISPLSAVEKDEEPRFRINIPVVSACMQSVSGTVEAADAATEVPEIDLLAMDPEMESFLDKYVRPVRTQRQRLHMLHRSLRAAGMLNLDYEPSANGTALETFHSAQANCLSYASLFVAMARAVGLHAEFQVVDTKPEWDRRGDRLAVAIHVNAVVKLKGNERFEVDIDPLSRSRIVGTRIIDDEEALALYHNNVGMEMVLAGDTAAGYKRLGKALDTVD